MRIKTFIVEDNMLAAESLEILLHKFPIIENVGVAKDKQSAIHGIKFLNPDLLFLDINLGMHSGFDIVDECIGHFKYVVFTTAYDEYALRAFNYNTLHYLLKPIDEKKIALTIERVHEYEKIKMGDEQLAELDLFRKEIKNVNKKTFFYFENRQWKSIDISAVVYIKGDGSYSTLFLKEGSIKISKNLKGTFEYFQQNPDFIRIHKSYVINRSFLKSVVKGMQSKVILINNIELPISAMEKAVIFNKLGL